MGFPLVSSNLTRSINAHPHFLLSSCNLSITLLFAEKNSFHISVDKYRLYRTWFWNHYRSLCNWPKSIYTILSRLELSDLRFLQISATLSAWSIKIKVEIYFDKVGIAELNIWLSLFQTYSLNIKQKHSATTTGNSISLTITK